MTIQGALLVACLLAASPVAVRAAVPLVQAGPISFAPLVRRVVPAVVNIAVTESVDSDGNPVDSASEVPPELRGTPFERQFRDRQRRRREQVVGAGSGFIIDPSGIIVTNDHVVGHADRIGVSLSDGRELPASIVGADELTDIAVIRVASPSALPYVPWGNSDALQVGDWIMAAGNPFGLGSSVTAGIVSARGRDIGAGPFDDFIQLDAPINPGNSGGPTFNLSGEVVALNTALVSPTGGSVGIGFAIPSNIVAGIVAALRTTGHIERGWLGVTLEDQHGTTGGVTITAIDHTGPGSRGGLREGDVILSIDGTKLDSARTLTRLVAAAGPRHLLQIQLRRQGGTLALLVATGLRPSPPG